MKSKFFKKIFLSALALTVTLSSIIGIFLYLSTIDEQKEKVSMTRNNTISQMKSNVDMRFNMSLSLIHNYINNPIFTIYAQNDIEDKYNTKKVVEAVVLLASIFPDMGYEIAVSKTGYDDMIGNGKITDFESYFVSREYSSEEAEHLKTILFALPSKEYSYFMFSNNSAFTLVYLKKVSATQSMGFFITFSTSELFSQYVSRPYDRFCIIYENEIIAYSETQNSGELLDAFRKLDASKFIDPDTIVLNQGSASEFRFVRSNILNEITIGYATEKIKFYSYENLPLVLIMFTMLLVFGVFLSLSIIKTIYKPVKNLVNLFNEGGQAYENELEFIEKSAIRITKENELLTSKVEIKYEKLKQRVLIELVYGLLSEAEINDFIEEYGLHEFHLPLNIVVLELPIIASISPNEVLEIMNGELLPLTSFVLTRLDYNNYAVIARGDELSLQKELFTKISNSFSEKLGIKVFVAIGKRVESVYDIHNSFMDAMFMLECRSFISKKSVITHKDIAGIRDINYYYPLEIEKLLISYIKNKEYDTMRTVLSNILTTNLKSYNMSVENLRDFASAICNTINRVLHIIGTNTQTVFGHDYVPYLEFRMCKTQEVLHKKILECFDILISKIGDDYVHSADSLASKIKRYIEHNYRKDLSLSDVADEFDISLAYVSKLFKNELNVNYKDYIDRFRIERAKELFDANDNAKVNYVASIVGFNNVGTFIRVFKKLEGISPGEYQARKKST